MKLQIVNHTAYQTRDLQALVRLVAAEELNPGQLDRLRIDFYYRGAPGARDDRRYRFRAGPPLADTGLRYTRFNITLRRPEHAGGKLGQLSWPATMLAHEMAECRGKKHARLYNTSRYGYLGREGAAERKQDHEEDPKHRSRVGSGAYWQRRLTELQFPGLRVKAMRPQRPKPVDDQGPTELQKLLSF